jgi:hypothetical protein
MQKLDFIENIRALKDILKSEPIVKFITSMPAGQAVNTGGLTPLIIESKSNFDKIAIDDPKFEILKALGGQELYSEASISALINGSVNVTLRKLDKVNLFLIPVIVNFYHFHLSIITSFELADKVLFKNKLSEITAEDTVVFRILIDGSLELVKYNKILTLLNDIIEIINKLNGNTDVKTKISLFDSGSDTNLGIKTTVETAKSLFQIFKEVWDWVVNRKFYKNKLRNSVLMENLQVMTAIKEACEKSIIDENTAKIYKETIIRRTEDLLELNVLPKELIEVRAESDSKKLLSEFTEIKMLESENKHL